jgi:hypothetical protein
MSAGFVVVVLLARQQYAKPIADGDARSDDQESAGEVLGVLAASIHRLPGDQHRHHGRLAAARRHLHGEPKQRLVGGLLIVVANPIQQRLRFGVLRRDLGQPNDGFDRLDLAKEGLRAIELMVAPIFG